MYDILKDRFSVVHKPFVFMAKLQFLAQFPVNYFAHPVVPSLILLLSFFAAFTYYVIDRFVSLITYPTSAVFLRLIYSGFDMVSPYGIVLCCR